MHGQGVLRTKAGSYEGSFEENKMHGKGTFTTIAGDKYEGDFENGARSGQGKLTFKDGSVYVGSFEVSAVHTTELD